MLSEDIVMPHPSGCGFYLHPPVGVAYQIFRSDIRTGIDGKTPGLLAQGFTHKPVRYLDWDVPINKPVTYRIEANGKKYERTVECDPQHQYSAVNDGDMMMDAPNPRDALIIYYATRLAQLVAANKLLVYPREGQTVSNHSKRYSVRSDYWFEESEVPMLVLDYSGGAAIVGDLGHQFTETHFRISGHFIATSREERDSAHQAILGLWAETEWFLEDIGCYESELTNVSQGVQADEPHVYMLDFDIIGVHTIMQSAQDRMWEMLRYTGWE